jgi:hypothetical protein
MFTSAMDFTDLTGCIRAQNLCIFSGLFKKNVEIELVLRAFDQ